VHQPISAAPLVATGVGGQPVVVVGTGKYLEIPDTALPVTPGASLYVLQENSAPLSGRSDLKAATVDTSDGSVSVVGLTPAKSKGWYLDFSAPLGERQISPLQLDRSRLTLNTLFPAGGACGEGGGRHYNLDILTGAGRFWESDVGLLGGSFRIEGARATVSKSDSSGGRIITYTESTGLQGAKGISNPQGEVNYTVRGGRLSWRVVNRTTP
jgi:Tfp pilus tip-associated adhesin PilY1